MLTFGILLMLFGAIMFAGVCFAAIPEICIYFGIFTIIVGQFISLYYDNKKEERLKELENRIYELENVWNENKSLWNRDV